MEIKEALHPANLEVFEPNLTQGRSQVKGGSLTFDSNFDVSAEQRHLQSFSGLSYEQSELFTDDFISRVSPEGVVQLGDEVQGTLDSRYNVVRFYVGTYPDLNTVNFWLNDQGQVERIDDMRNGPDASTLSQLVSAGGLKAEALELLGITPQEVESARSQRLERQENLAILERDSLDRLPNSYSYDGTTENTVTVLQGQGQFISPNGQTNGLYTFGAAPCSIVVAVGRESNGSVSKVGMAHVDANTPQTSISSFLEQARNSADNLEVYVISGESETALRVHSAVTNANGQLIFANIDRDGSRSDAVVVDHQGNVFYGLRQGLEVVNPQEMQVTALMRQMPNQPLRFRDNP